MIARRLLTIILSLLFLLSGVEASPFETAGELYEEKVVVIEQTIVREIKRTALPGSSPTYLKHFVLINLLPGYPRVFVKNVFPLYLHQLKLLI